MRFARTQGGELQLASVTLRDRHGHEVTLHGMVHIADRRFYDDMAAELDAAQARGAKILYEGLLDRGNPNPGVEADLVDQLDSLGHVYAALADAIGLVRQHKDALPIQDEWVNTDYTKTRLVRELPDAQRFVDELAKAGAETEKFANAADVLLTLFHHLPLTSRVGDVARLFSSYRRSSFRVISKRRSDFGVNAIISARAEGGTEIHALWGAAHLDHMTGELSRHGYRQVRETWRVAIGLQDRSKHESDQVALEPQK